MRGAAFDKKRFPSRPFAAEQALDRNLSETA
jgi:hypothetical protein